MLSGGAFAQEESQKSILMDIDPSLYYTEHYLFPEYSLGSIQFTDGTTYKGLLNILLAKSTLCFINDDGKPEIYPERSGIASVSIGRNFFIPMLDRYFQILDTDGNTLFAVDQYLELEAEKRYGAFGREEKSPNAIIEKLNLRSLGVNVETGGTALAAEWIPYEVRQNVYLVRGKKAFAPTEKNFKRFFPYKETFLKRYLADHSVDFDNADQTYALFRYLVAVE